MTATPITTLATKANTATLVAAVKDALRAVAKRPSVPVVSLLRLEGDPRNGMIFVTGFDYELSVTKHVDATGQFPPVLVPGIALRDALMRLDQKADVYIGVDGEKVILKQGTRSVTLKAPIPADEFPMLPSVLGPVFDTTGQVLTTGSRTR